MKSLTITGGGLAGLSLGLALRRRDVPVTLHEAGGYPRHRVCGEFIAGVSPSTLTELGVDRVLESALLLRSTAWYSMDKLVLKRNLPRPALGISRWALDAALAEEFKAKGGDLKTSSRRTAAEQLPSGEVQATGRVRSGQKPGWIGLKIHLQDLSLPGDLELHLGNSGYAGISRIENNALNLCGLFRVDPSIKGQGAEILEGYLRRCGLTRMAGYLSSGTPVASSFAAVSGMNYRLFYRPSPGFVIGDSWSLIPPFTGNGMSLAFESAQLAVDALADWSVGDLTWDAAVRSYRSRLRSHLLPRVVRGRFLHSLLLLPGSRKFLGWLAREDYLPFRTLYFLTH